MIKDNVTLTEEKSDFFNNSQQNVIQYICIYIFNSGYIYGELSLEQGFSNDLACTHWRAPEHFKT